MSMIKPKFKHDCQDCIFLGRHNDHDLYFCKQGGNRDTVIARFGNHGSNYASGLQFAEVGGIPELHVAKNLAKQKNLL